MLRKTLLPCVVLPLHFLHLVARSAENICKVTPDGSHRIIEISTRCTALDVCSEGLGVGAVKALGGALKRVPTVSAGVKKLQMCAQNRIGVKGARKLSKILQYTTQLTEIEVSGNEIGADGAKALTEAFRHMPQLAKIDLSNNSIRHVGAEAVAEALHHTPNLLVIDLRQNSIGDMGAVAISNALRHTPHLQELALRDNNITDVGAKSIASELWRTPQLVKIRVHKNDIGDEGAKALASSIVKLEASRGGRRFVVTSGIEKQNFLFAEQEAKYGGDDNETRTHQQTSALPADSRIASSLQLHKPSSKSEETWEEGRRNVEEQTGLLHKFLLTKCEIDAESLKSLDSALENNGVEVLEDLTLLRDENLEIELEKAGMKQVPRVKLTQRLSRCVEEHLIVRTMLDSAHDYYNMLYKWDGGKLVTLIVSSLSAILASALLPWLPARMRSLLRQAQSSSADD